MLHTRGKKSKKIDKDSQSRIAIVNANKCKPNKCKQECKKSCPVISVGKQCIKVESTSKISYISDVLCVGCGICVKKCPFNAISIINLPSTLDSQTTHRFGPNSFKLHNLPTPRSGEVLGLVGSNGIGKSTALKILAGKLIPNLGNFENPPHWTDIITYFRGSELQNYFTKMRQDQITAVIKPQYVDKIPKTKGSKIVGDIVSNRELIESLDLCNVLNREIQHLSGGELQRVAIAAVCQADANMYIYDEPSSYLDIKQRLQAGKVIRSMRKSNNYVIVVEHDLSLLDYLSDFVCVLYGTPGIYGVVTMPYSVREGINIFLDGMIPTENVRFREESLSFKLSDGFEESSTFKRFTYPHMTKTLDGFKLHIDAGEFTDSEIIVMLGQNGCGKTTFIRMLAGQIEADLAAVHMPTLNASYKPQNIYRKFNGTVRQLLHQISTPPQFNSDVMRPLNMDSLMDEYVNTLSGGELQRVAIVLCLGTPADIYLLDEPSAYLDSEQRVIISKVIKRFIRNSKKPAFIVEHDFIMATYLADSVIVFSGVPAIECTVTAPQSLVSGMNKFLEDLDITFRRDPTNYRPRINKLASVKDKEQKLMGTYFFMDGLPQNDSPQYGTPHDQKEQ